MRDFSIEFFIDVDEFGININIAPEQDLGNIDDFSSQAAILLELISSDMFRGNIINKIQEEGETNNNERVAQQIIHSMESLKEKFRKRDCLVDPESVLTEIEIV